MAEVTMPRLSDSMEEGTIIRWLHDDGEEVAVRDELVEVETDKATIVYEAEAAGRLTIVAAVGTTIPVGSPIAYIGEPPADRAGGTDPRTDRPASSNGRPKASPVARRLARALGVELAQLAGTGPSGRIVKRDVEAAAGSATRAEQAGATRPERPATGPAAGSDAAFHPFTSVQTTIARRMSEAKATMPEFTLSTEIDMEAAVALRGQFAELLDGPPPSLGDFVVRACALALREHPNVNAAHREGGVERFGRVNVGVAVAAPGALFVPTVADADRKALAEIAAEVRELAQRGREGRLTPAEVSGATFTVSNLGMFGVTEFTAVLNPPQAAILAVGAVGQRVVAWEGQPAVRQRMTVTLTCDHRVLYGADAAAFLAVVRDNLERPLRLVI